MLFTIFFVLLLWTAFSLAFVIAALSIDALGRWVDSAITTVCFSRRLVAIAVYPLVAVYTLAALIVGPTKRNRMEAVYDFLETTEIAFWTNKTPAK